MNLDQVQQPMWVKKRKEWEWREIRNDSSLFRLLQLFLFYSFLLPFVHSVLKLIQDFEFPIWLLLMDQITLVNHRSFFIHNILFKIQ